MMVPSYPGSEFVKGAREWERLTGRLRYVKRSDVPGWHVIVLQQEWVIARGLHIMGVVAQYESEWRDVPTEVE